MLILANNDVILANMCGWRSFFLFAFFSSSLCRHQKCLPFAQSLLIHFNLSYHCFCSFLFFMGHEPSHFAPLDPDLEDENDLIQLDSNPTRTDACQKAWNLHSCKHIYSHGTLICGGAVGRQQQYISVARMDKQTFSRLVNLMRGAGLNDNPHISVEEKPHSCVCGDVQSSNRSSLSTQWVDNLQNCQGGSWPDEDHESYVHGGAGHQHAPIICHC
jgi:hypothetical protein